MCDATMQDGQYPVEGVLTSRKQDRLLPTPRAARDEFREFDVDGRERHMLATVVLRACDSCLRLERV